MKKSIIYILLALLLLSCKKVETPDQESNFYSVITFFENSEEYKYTFEQLQNSIHDTLIVINDKSLKIGRFDTFRAASDQGFELFADDLIKNYDVIYKDSVIKNDYDPLYFVGYDLGRPALYKIDILKDQPELIWSKWGRKIMHLHRSENRGDFFFSASLSEDIRGNFPLVMDARLYMFNRVSERISLVRYFGRGLNLSTGWESDSSFAAYFTTLDSMLTSTIIQRKFTYDADGEQRDSTENIFNLVKEGIPIPTFESINPISPNLRYKIAIGENDSTSSLNIIDELNGSNNFITDVNSELKENKWNAESDYLFAKFESKKSPDTTDLYVVDLKEMKLIEHFRSAGRKNFIILGNLLIFDEGYEADSYITLYRYRRNKIYSEIRIPGGCGVNSIPSKTKLF